MVYRSGMSLPGNMPQHVLYLPGMETGASPIIAWPAERSGWVLIRRGVIAPGIIEATGDLIDLGFTVELTVHVDSGGSIRVTHLAITPHGRPANRVITTRALRALKLDQLARDVVRQLEQPVTEREDMGSGVFQVPGDSPNAFWVSRPVPGRRPTPRELAEKAARIYAEAKAEGSRAPTNAVASELGYSRSQASRMIRTARDLGLLADTKPTPQPNEGKEPSANDQDD